MQYRVDPKTGNKLSILGYGCMRFPRNLGRIDMEKTEKLVLEAYDQGINYYDTAYLYMGSEEALGEILNKHNLRNQVFIATKLPIMQCKKYEDFERLFQLQLSHLQTDYIDYYFMHALSDLETWQKLCELGIEKWITEKKMTGQIRQVGFSFHGTNIEFENLLNAYDWDFVQIQYNYVNTNYQAGSEGLKKAAAKGMPVFIMEPLLGGKLANGLPKTVVNKFKKHNSKLTPAAWALKWLWDQEAVTVVLSGMSDPQVLSENLETASHAQVDQLTEEEHLLFSEVVDLFQDSYKIPCTGCNYCMPCPENINIPANFQAYNISFAIGKFAGLQQYITSTGATSRNKASASDCIACKKCEKHCPQHIEISKAMIDVKKRMEPFWFNWGMKIIQKVLDRS